MKTKKKTTTTRRGEGGGDGWETTTETKMRTGGEGVVSVRWYLVNV